MLHVLICCEKIKFYWKLCFKGAKELSSKTQLLHFKIFSWAQKALLFNSVFTETLLQGPKELSQKT
jgi:hypothetical protein